MWALPLGATLLCLALRLPGLMKLPIFCDESIYLRYAQLIHRAPLANAFVSLVDPKPPLHYWLLASLFDLTADPLLSARLLSVIAGLASVLIVIPLCGELRALSRPDDAGMERRPAALGLDGFAASACLLFLTCPFFAFYQRMALAESLLIVETLWIAWLGLRLARGVAQGASLSATLCRSLALGLAMGLALLTKQVYSYMMLGIPIAARAVWRSGLLHRRRAAALWRSWLLSYVLALLLFSPILFVTRGPGLRDRLFFRATHGSFGGGIGLHARLVRDNLLYLFVPTVIDRVPASVLDEGFQAPADAGWLWIYLTPPVYLVSLGGFAALAWRRELRILGFLIAWAVLMLLPFIPFAATAVSRYALLAVPPLLLAGAYLLDVAIEGLGARLRQHRLRSLTVASLALLLIAWPAWSIALQDFSPQRQALTRSDRWQYVSGWPAGLASRRAVDSLREISKREPIVVITSSLPGTPNHVLWVYLEGEPNVSRYFVLWGIGSPILISPPEAPDRLLLLSNFGADMFRRELVAVPPGVPILFVAIDPYPGGAGPAIPAETVLRPHNPELREVARFSNPPMGLPHAPDSVVIYRLR